MSRLPRIKVNDGEGWYHLHARVAGVNGEYPLESAACRRKLVSLLEHFSRRYQCRMAAFSVMGNHWHAVMHFEAPRALENNELLQLARRFYPGENGKKLLSTWTDRDWARFASRVFDVSEFMRNVQSDFARWYNRNHNRRGRFWAERFGSVLLESEEAVLDCMLYIELNPVRAGIARLPENHRGSSSHLRAIGKADWLMPIGHILQARTEKLALKEYRALLIWRGTEPTKIKQAAIPRSVARRERERGYPVRGAYAKRVAYLTEGLVLGSSEFVKNQLDAAKKLGYYLRRRNPIQPQASPHCVLRPQQNR